MDSMEPITSSDRSQTLGPHPEDAALFARQSRRMAAGTISLVAVLRDARKSALLRTRPMDDIDMIRCERCTQDHGLPPYSAGAAAGIGCSNVAPSSMPGCSGRRLPSH